MSSPSLYWQRKGYFSIIISFQTAKVMLTFLDDAHGWFTNVSQIEVFVVSHHRPLYALAEWLCGGWWVLPSEVARTLFTQLTQLSFMIARHSKAQFVLKLCGQSCSYFTNIYKFPTSSVWCGANLQTYINGDLIGLHIYQSMGWL